MEGLYRRPLRVYLILGALAVWGIVSGLNLSISLFPMSSQAQIQASLAYGSASPAQFFQSVGRDIESSLQNMKANGFSAINVTATYGKEGALYHVTFEWGTDPDEALKVAESLIRAQINNLEESVSRSLQIYSWRENQGFFALSFYSPLRSLDDLYQILNPLVRPLRAKIADASEVGLFNPNGKEITIRLNPQRLAQTGLHPAQIDQALRSAITEMGGGALVLGESSYQLTLPKLARQISDLEKIRVSDPQSAPLLLKDVATLSVNISEESKRRYKTSGVESLILFASPRDGGNIKRMSDDLMKEIKVLQAKLPSDIQFKILVNPSEFINRSIGGVLREVGLAALLAVMVLFVFIGSFRNVVTAAIEIPLSLLMAFILMKLTGMNLNLISLGGLALSAGMNVDASVVVLENIFRHFEGKPKTLSFEEKAQILIDAVREVRVPILASTAASLIVFLPLIFTNGLTSSLLGDLAKAVIFSHGLSAVVALVLVPTIRLQLLRTGDMGHSHSHFEKQLRGFENLYASFLGSFLKNGRAQALTFAIILAVLSGLLIGVVPLIKKEVIGKPDSDWLVVAVDTPLLGKTKEVEGELDQLETDLMGQIGDDVLYTFGQVREGGGSIMLRLKDKRKMAKLKERLSDTYVSTPEKSYSVVTWNPSELRIPDPPDLRVDIIGGTDEMRRQIAQDMNQSLLEDKVFENIDTNFSPRIEKGISVSPLNTLGSQPEVLSRDNLSFFLRTALEGRFVEKFSDNETDVPIYLRFPKESVSSLESLKALPVGFENRLIPLGALARFEFVDDPPVLFRENQQPLFSIRARKKEADDSPVKEKVERAKDLVQQMQKKIDRLPETSRKSAPFLSATETDKDLQDAFDQLKWAIAVSVLLIFLTMMIQMGDLVSSLIVLVSIPLGVIGVIVSLAVFQSSLSLNSGLGTILLNGIAVANSIILVDFIRRLSDRGLTPYEATVEASVARLRPILMTTLTTVLGMLPIALGFGEGGKTLQPLGITVCGGLWVSTLFTLILVPTLQYRYLRWRQERSR